MKLAAIRALALALCVPAWAAAAEFTAEAFEPAEALFRQDPRWLGSDGAVSTALGDGRIFWSFDDSFVAISPTGGRDGSVMVRNSIAIQSGLDPLTARMDFHWRASGTGQPGSFFPDPDPAWYWTGAALRLDQGPLVSFLFTMEATPGEALGFQPAGYALAVIHDPDAPPGEWLPRITPGPVTQFDALPAAALVREGEHVVGLALKQHGTHAGALVRFRSADLANGMLDAAEWWAGEDRGWLPAGELGARGPEYVIEDAGAEASLHWDQRMQAWVHVAAYGFGAGEIGVRTAPRLTGPWSAVQRVYRPPESDRPGTLVYAAMAHPALAAPQPGAILVTYATNSSDFSELFSPGGARALYWPRVVVLTPRFR
ncbi:MAG: DUF5005 domain-containing protein [Xanthomonadales bacterium]|nr:DUF5005 domain-containing protein [Xanthomonadales bacterium]